MGGQFFQTGIQQGLQASVQTSQGLDLALPAALSLQSTVFLHDYFGLPDVSAPCSPAANGSECITPNVNGRAYGLEVLLRRSFAERFTAWVSYTLSRSTRQARGPGADEPTMTILSEYDRTHVVSAVASYDFGNGWHAGGRVFAYTGRPYADTSGGVPVLPYNTERLPGYFRIDARIEKSWTIGAHVRFALVLEGINVTLNKEPVSATCRGPDADGPGDRIGRARDGVRRRWVNRVRRIRRLRRLRRLRRKRRKRRRPRRVHGSVDRAVDDPEHRRGGHVPLTREGWRATCRRLRCGSNSVVECHLAKVDVEGSNPFSRSLFIRWGLNQRQGFCLSCTRPLRSASRTRPASWTRCRKEQIPSRWERRRFHRTRTSLRWPRN